MAKRSKEILGVAVSDYAFFAVVAFAVFQYFDLPKPNMFLAQDLNYWIQIAMHIVPAEIVAFFVKNYAVEKFNIKNAFRGTVSRKRKGKYRRRTGRKSERVTKAALYSMMAVVLVLLAAKVIETEFPVYRPHTAISYAFSHFIERITPDAYAANDNSNSTITVSDGSAPVITNPQTGESIPGTANITETLNELGVSQQEITELEKLVSSNRMDEFFIRAEEIGKNNPRNQYSQAQINAKLIEVFGPGGFDTATYIIGRESSWKHYVIGDDTLLLTDPKTGQRMGWSVGLMQIRTGGQSTYGIWNRAEKMRMSVVLFTLWLQNPMNNIEYARTLYDAAGWSPWKVR